MLSMNIRLYFPHLPAAYFITAMASSSDKISLSCPQNVEEWVPEGFVCVVGPDNQQYYVYHAGFYGPGNTTKI